MRGPTRGSDPDLSGIRSGRAVIEVLLRRVRDDKRQKNRLHLDLRTADLDAEVGRVLGLGAILLTPEAVVEDGWRWRITADPDGNEFCVLQPPADGDPGA